MATRDTSKKAARRRAKTNPADDRATRARRAKAPGAPAWQAVALEAAPTPRHHEPTPSPLVAVDVLWAAVASARTRRPSNDAEPNLAPAPIGTSTPEAEPALDAAPTLNATPVLDATPALDTTLLRHRIAQRAYALAEASGFRIDPFHAWLRAEREIVAAIAPLKRGLTHTFTRTKRACRSTSRPTTRTRAAHKRACPAAACRPRRRATSSPRRPRARQARRCAPGGSRG